MRRPLKPFVTEYKASNRRNAGAASEQGIFETERPAPKPFDFALKAEPEDSYDAAMRAADALFSIPSQTKPESSESMSVEPKPTPPGTSPRLETPAPSPERGGGRILRVLDEAPPPEYAALEAERAPKRRGRKPGSKNKPKPQVLMALTDPTPETPAAHLLPPTPEAFEIMPAAPAARKVAAISAEAVTHQGEQAPSRGDKRFPWVRDRLKPGEDWKRRRLPRICW